MTETIRVIYEEKEFDIEFWYQPEEKQTRDYPGSAEEIELSSVINVISGTEFLPAIETLNLTDEFEQLVWDKMEEERNYH